MTKMPTQFKYQKQIWALGGILGVLVFTYVGLVGSTVYNTLERQRGEKQISQVTGQLSEMEFSYLGLKSKVNPELARSRGFIDADNIIVAKKDSGVTAFVNKERI
ncbi:MAG: hypothetical protein JWP09_155 [Candidatus Taylorbacteria bacterium]|nr:hypothetical protein [Candidatus Taylorbacteria bacterium]